MALAGRFVAWGGVSATEAAVWWSDDGTTWNRSDVQLAQANAVAAGTRGFVLVGGTELPGIQDGSEVWFSADGVAWDGPYDGPAGLQDAWGIVELAMGDDLIVGSGIGPNPDRSGADPWLEYVVVGTFLDD